VIPPPSPVIYKVELPVAASLLASNVSNVVPGGFTGFGENDAVIPDGKFDTENVTGFVNPPVGLTEIKNDELWSGFSVSVSGWRVKLKFCVDAVLVKPRTRGNTANKAFIKLSFFITVLFFPGLNVNAKGSIAVFTGKWLCISR
jgi:hypothetical protein